MASLLEEGVDQLKLTWLNKEEGDEPTNEEGASGTSNTYIWGEDVKEEKEFIPWSVVDIEIKAPEVVRDEHFKNKDLLIIVSLKLTLKEVWEKEELEVEMRQLPTEFVKNTEKVIPSLCCVPTSFGLSVISKSATLSLITLKSVDDPSIVTEYVPCIPVLKLNVLVSILLKRGKREWEQQKEEIIKLWSNIKKPEYPTLLKADILTTFDWPSFIFTKEYDVKEGESDASMVEKEDPPFWDNSTKYPFNVVSTPPSYLFFIESNHYVNQQNKQKLNPLNVGADQLTSPESKSTEEICKLEIASGTEGPNVGAKVGEKVGEGVGWKVGDGVGWGVGWKVGEGVGSGVGWKVGEEVGLKVGDGVGFGVGLKVGNGVGLKVGKGVGLGVGLKVGDGVGSNVGASVEYTKLGEKRTKNANNNKFRFLHRIFESLGI